MFEYVVGVSLGVIAFVKLWDWIDDRIADWAIARKVFGRGEE